MQPKRCPICSWFTGSLVIPTGTIFVRVERRVTPVQKSHVGAPSENDTVMNEIQISRNKKYLDVFDGRYFYLNPI